MSDTITTRTKKRDRRKPFLFSISIAKNTNKTTKKEVDEWQARDLILVVEKDEELYERMVQSLARKYVQKLKRARFQKC
jgi:hypothetical protein